MSAGVGSRNVFGDVEGLPVDRDPVYDIVKQLPDGCPTVLVAEGINPEALSQPVLGQIEKRLESRQCVALKLYPAYYPIYVWDSVYEPLYRLAERYAVPVWIHTGVPAMKDRLVKYSHPLTVDEVAVKHRAVNFVLAHLGNPWTLEAMNVVMKNPNVFADLSGLVADYFEDTPRWVLPDRVREDLQYISDPSKLIFGSDWPVATSGYCIEFLLDSVLTDPPYNTMEARELIFRDNARTLLGVE
jgi:predicted TIM-barrel fold metal-dependent hydrolase